MWSDMRKLRPQITRASLEPVWRSESVLQNHSQNVSLVICVHLKIKTMYIGKSLLFLELHVGVEEWQDGRTDEHLRRDCCENTTAVGPHSSHYSCATECNLLVPPEHQCSCFLTQSSTNYTKRKDTWSVYWYWAISLHLKVLDNKQVQI